MTDPSKYDIRGVSASKSDVHKAISNLDKGLYPLAFCKILPDLLTGDPDFVNIMHADTAGTKTSLAYIYWKETGDLSVWKGIAQDAIVMNVDDMACVGAVDNIILSNTIGRNKSIIPGEVIEAIINGTVEFVENMAQHGVDIHLSGGETADVGDIVRSIDVGFTAFTRLAKKDLIVNDIKPGQSIIGLASYGQSIYESGYNGGMGSNGLTSARHDILHEKYRSLYPESFDNHIPVDYVYAGSKNLTDKLQVDDFELDIGKLILSPTRTFLPFLKRAISNHKSGIHGIIHNTGGAHTKVKKFAEGVRIIKDNLLAVPPLFELIQQESGTAYNEMFQVFNMGTRLELYVDPEIEDEIISIAQSLHIEAQKIGHVEAADKTEVLVKFRGENLLYD